MTKFFAVRGDRPLKEEEYKAHLTQALRLENVGLLLGAGASVDAGGSTMKKIWENIQEDNDTVKWLKDEKFIGLDESVNLEKLIDRLEIAHLEWQRQSSSKLQTLNDNKTKIYRYILEAALLAKNCWENPASHNTSATLKYHRHLLAKLVSNRQLGQSSPWIFTTNYDLAIEWSAEALELNVINGFSGTHCRKFTPNSFDLGYRNIRTRGEAQFGVYNVYLAKLHGSLTWQIDTVGNVLELQSAYQKVKIDEFLQSESKSKEIPGILIYPGSAKCIESTGFIYGEMLRRFSEFLARSNTCLLVNGYGFNDEHINKIVAGALQNPTLQLIVYYADADADADSFNQFMASQNALARIAAHGLPQLTICFGNTRAHFKQLVEDLPEPTLVDEQAEKARKLMKEFSHIEEPRASYTSLEEDNNAPR